MVRIIEDKGPCDFYLCDFHKWMSPVQLMKMFIGSSSWLRRPNKLLLLFAWSTEWCEWCYVRVSFIWTGPRICFFTTVLLCYVSYFIAYCKYIIVCIISKFKMLSSSDNTSLHYISMGFILHIYNWRQFLGHGLCSVIQSSLFCHEDSSKLSLVYWIVSRSCGSWKLFFPLTTGQTLLMEPCGCDIYTTMMSAMSTNPQTH